MLFADVVLPLPVDHPFTYEIPSDIKVVVGSRVLVPFHKQKKVGFVIALHDRGGHHPLKKIEALPGPPETDLSPSYLEWLIWASHYYLAPLGEVLATALPSPFFKLDPRQSLPQKKSRSSPLADHWVHEKEVVLNDEQQKVFLQIRDNVFSGEFKPILLHGVTGSGKTEIYIHLIHEIIRSGKQVLYLVPEIGLTPQIVARLRHHFGEKLALYHSGLTENQRLREWLRVKSGTAVLLVGTRSALFGPFCNLGMIIIDEEHDSSYKQEERFRYQARDLALVRGKMEKIPVLMGSATPSLESYFNAKNKKYLFYSLTNRPEASAFPKITLIDMTVEKRQSGSPLILCRELHQAIADTLNRREQVLILFNRRGFAVSHFCLACQKGVVCPHCSVVLPYHKKQNILLCHYCDASQTLTSVCPSCGSSQMTLIGSGTETLEGELKTFYPQARINRLDRDSVQKKGALLSVLKDLREGKIDILVGTQMIAKGHDIARVTLVGVVGIDAVLGVPDFRSSERCFQLLTQVAGRAGRGTMPGKVIVQSFNPKHFSIKAVDDHAFDRFYEQELKWRSELGYPPYGRLIDIRFFSPDSGKIQHFIKWLFVQLPSLSIHETKILGPAPSPIEKLRGRYRWHLVLKGTSPSALRQTALKILSLRDQGGFKGIKWAVDVDPINML